MTDEELFQQVVRAAGLLTPASCLHLDFTSGSIDADLALLQDMTVSQSEREMLRLWTGPQSLVTSPRLARTERFQQASEASAARGWPVIVRPSAGLTVAHHPGILNISHLKVLLADGGPPKPLSAYDGLLQMLVRLCARFGLEADHGAVPGSYCDGAHNLRVAGRKLAGLSARIITRNGMRGVLAHACLTVHADTARDVAAVQAFERDLGLPALYRAGAHCSLAGELSKSAGFRLSRLPSLSGM